MCVIIGYIVCNVCGHNVPLGYRTHANMQCVLKHIIDLQRYFKGQLKQVPYQFEHNPTIIRKMIEIALWEAFLCL